MRDVIVYEWEINNETARRTGKKIELGEAAFHQFGTNYEEFEKGPGNYSVAIVEHRDGTVECVDPELIKFIS